MPLPPRCALSNLLMLGFLCLIASQLQADWELVKDEDDVQVYTRVKENSPYKEFKGVITIDSSLASVVGVLNDNSACPDWLHQCKTSELLTEVDATNRYVYQVNDLPFPAANRDLVMHTNIQSDVVSRVISITTRATPDYYPRTSYVRILESNGLFELTPVSPDQTRVVWQQHVDPAGKIPSFMVNALLIDLPFKSLTALRQLAKKARYQQLELNYNDAGQLISIFNKSW